MKKHTSLLAVVLLALLALTAFANEPLKKTGKETAKPATHEGRRVPTSQTYRLQRIRRASGSPVQRATARTTGRVGWQAWSANAGAVVLENRDPRAYQWEIQCKIDSLYGNVPADGLVYFQQRSSQQAPCFLRLRKSDTPETVAQKVRMVGGQRWIIREGRLTRLVIQHVQYPPVSVVGPGHLARDPSLVRQWASKARASSEYTSSSWGAVQLIGPASVSGCQDSAQAWVAKTADRGHEWIELEFAKKSRAIGVLIYVNWYPGVVVAVKAKTGAGWETVWQGRDPTGQTCPVIFAIPFQEPVDTQQIRIILDTRKVPGWNEIDAVRLVSLPEGSR